MIAQMDGLFCLDVKSKIEFMKVLEVIFKDYSYYKLSDKVIEREYLLYILTLKEICVGASITEWIGCYNKKVLKSICSSQAVPLAGKTDRFSVCMLKGALDGFEKSVNFFNETSYDDVEAILSNEDNDFTFDSKYKNSPCNDLMSFNFTMNLKNGRMIKFSRFDDFKFEIVYKQKGYSLSYTNGSINFKEGRKVAYKIEFDKIDRYGDEYIEEITRKINEVSECVNKLVRGKESKEKKLL